MIGDNGYYSEEAVKAVERVDEEGTRQGPEVYCAVGRQTHHRTVVELEKREEPAKAAQGAPVKEVMEERGGEKDIQERERDGRAGIWDNKAGDVVSAISATWIGAGRDRMEPGGFGVQHEAVEFTGRRERSVFFRTAWINRLWKEGVSPGFQRE